MKWVGVVMKTDGRGRRLQTQAGIKGGRPVSESGLEGDVGLLAQVRPLFVILIKQQKPAERGART